MQQDLIIELGTEELPPMSLVKMSLAFSDKIKLQLNNKKLLFTEISAFATPRRIAVLIKNLQAAQDLVVAEILLKAVNDLPGKKMRWGNGDYVFARPVHWLVVLYGTQVINVNLFGLTASNITYGHRFLAPDPIILCNASEYEYILQQQGKVIVDFHKRKQLILTEIARQEQLLTARCIVDELLLEEVTAITEYPIGLVANFATNFLNLPKECLISAMGRHQKSFALVDPHNNLIPKFLLISNMPINNLTNIIQGNERVMHARLQDAAFLYQQDLKNKLDNNLERLKIIVLHEQLGSLYQQTTRIQNIAVSIARSLLLSVTQQEHIKQAALWCKADLVTEMVTEYPELQGIMGYYYALNEKAPLAVAVGIKEHYLPRFADDILPASLEGTCLALAYRLDLLFGLFAIGKAPSGEKDPFALRRHAIAIIRIIIEKKLFLKLTELFKLAAANYGDLLVVPQNIFNNLTDFCIDRLKNWYITKGNGITNKLFTAVIEASLAIDNIYDIDLRIQAILRSNIATAENLLQANKRINNILVKNKRILSGTASQAIDKNLLVLPEEIALYSEMLVLQEQFTELLNNYEYNAILQKLLTLTAYLDNFFDKVMVMVEEETIRLNRLLLLNELATLFKAVADLSLLI